MATYPQSPMPVRRVMLAALLAGLSGCVIAPYAHGPYRSDAGPPEGPVVEVAPPPPQYEVIPAMPALGWLWINGYWSWQLGRHVWIGGRWVAPRPGYHWVPHRWERHPRGWRLHDGHWGRR